LLFSKLNDIKLAERREQMLEVVERWHQSGLTQEAFVDENQLAIHQQPRNQLKLLRWEHGRAGDSPC
jgi:hypothetical protein